MSYVRVVIPTYNRAHLVTSAVESALSQTCRDVEVVVVDDGSADDTERVVTKIAARDARVTYLRKTNGGVSSARNFGMSKPGSYSLLAFLDADDVWTCPTHLEKASSVFARHPEVVLAYARVRTVDHVGQWTSERVRARESRYDLALRYAHERTADGVAILKAGDTFYALIASDVAPHPSTVVINPSATAVELRFNEALAVFEDINLFCRLARGRSFAFIDEVVATAQYHGDNLTKRQPLGSAVELRRWRSLLDHHLEMYALTRSPRERRIVARAISDHAYMVGQCLSEQGRDTDAIDAYVLSLRHRFKGASARSLAKNVLRRINPF